MFKQLGRFLKNIFTRYKGNNMENLLTRAERGEAEAQLQLGWFYCEGEHRDWDKAIFWLKKAAEQQNVEAIYWLGEVYAASDDELLNQKAMIWYSKAAKLEHAESQYIMANYHYNHNTQGGEKIGLQWYQRAAENGHSTSQYTMGNFYYNGKEGLVEQDDQQALYWYQRAAEQGDSQAQYQLGKMYRLGMGCERNLQQAMNYYQQAANQGNKQAQMALSDLYQNSKASAQDLPTAFMWCEKAALQGDKEAQYHLSLMYKEGIGTEKDAEKSLVWLLKSAENGCGEARFQLALNYENGLGVPKDIQQASQWFIKAHWEKHSYATLHAGLRWESAVGIEQDYVEARDCYMDLAYMNTDEEPENLKSVSDIGKTLLGRLNFLGKGNDFDDLEDYLKPDYKEAKEYWEMAAENNEPLAQLNLALIYEHGIGVERDLKQAKQWREQAEKNLLRIQQNENELYHYQLLQYYNQKGTVEEDITRAIEYYQKQQAWCEKLDNLKKLTRKQKSS